MGDVSINSRFEFRILIFTDNSVSILMKEPCEAAL